MTAARRALGRLAEEHGLRIEEPFTVSPVTPSTPRAEAVAARGPLIDGVEGSLALIERPLEDGGTTATGIVLVHLPTTIARLPELLCRDAFWRVTREYELSTNGLTRLDHETIFESASVERRFAVEHPAGTDAIFLRRLFSPTFLDWLGDHAPEDVFFELVSGRLSVIQGRDLDLEMLWEAAARIAGRLRDEVGESPRGAIVPFAEPLPAPASPDEDTVRRLARVRWDEPPPDTLTAAKAYRRHAGGGPGVYARAWLIAGALAAIPFVLGVGLALIGEILWPLGLIFGALVIFWTVFPLLVRGPRDSRAVELGKLAFAEGVAASEGLALEEPQAAHERWPALPLPGPVRRLWRGTTADGRTFRLALLNDPTGTPGRSGFEALLVEDGAATPVPSPAGPEPEVIRHDGVLALVRPTPLPQGANLAGLRELRTAAG